MLMLLLCLLAATGQMAVNDKPADTTKSSMMVRFLLLAKK